MSEPPHVFKFGDLCRVIDAKGNRKDAKVILASPNGQSLAVAFEGFFSPRGQLGGFLGMMPLSWCDDHFESFDLTGSSEAAGTVKIEPR